MVSNPNDTLKSCRLKIPPDPRATPARLERKQLSQKICTNEKIMCY